MKILFCRTGWNKKYNGDLTNDPLINGGSYNKEKVGYEAYNFKKFAGKYYGFIEPMGSIHLEKISSEAKKSDYLEGVLIIWFATKPKTGGQYVVGWYKNATVYRQKSNIPNTEIFKERLEKGLNLYNIESDNAFLLDESMRNFKIKGAGQNPLWYQSEAIREDVVKYIKDIEEGITLNINEKILEQELTGKEREAIVKIRENQGRFRQQLIDKYQHKCALCGINMNELLFASHIKPWSVSEDKEKIKVNNGILLCSNHDKLFDNGLISFDDDGNILISSKIDEINRKFTNINLSMKIEVNEEMQKFLKYHRENIYKN